MAAEASRTGGETRRRSTRLAAILDALAAEGEVDVQALARRCGVSASTVRRDLARLEEQHLLTRVHGGAVGAGMASPELPVRYRDGQADAGKQAIAREAARRVPVGRAVVGLTGGTTTSAVARELASRADLTIVTNAVNIAAELAGTAAARVFLTGGFLRPRSYELVGPSAAESLSRLTIGCAFVGVDGISADAGLTTHDEVEAQTNLAMIRRTRRVIVVADGRKVGASMLARMAAVGMAHELITSCDAPAAGLTALRQAGLRVCVVHACRAGADPCSAQRP